MKKILFIQFDPIVNGETTLIKSLKNILETDGYIIDIVYPTLINKKNKLQIPKNFIGKIESYKTYDDILNYSKSFDVIFCINSKYQKIRKTEENLNILSDTLNFFESFTNQNFIFFEHGEDTSYKAYKYDLIFEKLKLNHNKIKILANINSVSSVYKDYNVFLLRQPFDTSIYPQIFKNQSKIINFCFNSRYTSVKSPFKILPYFDNFFKFYKFYINFRGNVSDPVSIWYNIKHYFLNNTEHLIMNKLTYDYKEIYNYQDFIIYAGNSSKNDKGRIEYAILEAIYYKIPIIIHEDVFNDFKYQEYNLSKEFLKKCFIVLNEKNILDILNNNFDSSNYIINATQILQDFSKEKILKRFQKCIDSFNN